MLRTGQYGGFAQPGGMPGGALPPARGGFPAAGGLGPPLAQRNAAQGSLGLGFGQPRPPFYLGGFAQPGAPGGNYTIQGQLGPPNLGQMPNRYLGGFAQQGF